MRISELLLLSGILMFLLFPCHEMKAQSQEYGYVDFGVSCNEEVQADFDRALAMLHNMMYVTARGDFEEITKVDPECAMAYWGIATTLFQPLWGTRPGEQELQQGLQNINKALELADSEREKLLIESTAAFFHEPETADFWTRIQSWTDAVEVAYKAYPDDVDIAALYGLTRLTLAQRAVDRDPLHDEAEAIFREVYEQFPSHPGAIHYTIHATDVDGRAENALDIVESYGKIAPDVPHALHMPTHIYVRLGDWDKVIEWNLRSADAALKHPVNGSESHHYLHAMDYLVYAYLQRGQDQKAEEVFTKVMAKDRYQASFVSAFHFAAIPARLAVERRNWKQAAELEPRTPDYLPWDNSPWAEGLTWYAKGLGAVHLGEIESAKKAERQLKKLRDSARESGADNIASYIEVDRRVLEGWIAYTNGSEDKAVQLIRSAADLEKNIEKHPVTPGALQPSNEALGDLLLDLNRPSEALEAYTASDKLWPGRLNTLIGAALAARLTGAEKSVRSHIGKLLGNVGEL